MPKRGRTPAKTRPTKRSAKRSSRTRRKGVARPMRSLKQSYRGTPNQYRFVRETVPITIDIGNNATPGVTIIPSSNAGEPNISCLRFPNFQMQLLSAFVTEFSPLFGNYKVDKIETFMVPMWQQNIHEVTAVPVAAVAPNLMVTRINTKYLPNGYGVQNDAMTQRMHLAQVQMKTRSLYGTKKWLKIDTKNPGIKELTYSGDPPQATGETTIRSPWMPIATASDQEFTMNDAVFFDRLDGGNFPGNSGSVYLYRLYHKVHFRVSLVG